MKQKLILVFLFVLTALNSYSQKSEAEKAIYKPQRSGRTFEKALKHPDKATYVFISNFRDSIFPNNEFLKLKNVKQIVLVAKDTLRKKRSDSLSEPIKLRIDTSKLKQLSNLKYLTLNYFDLRNFPVELCYLQNLIGLDISTCFIDSLPNEIGNLKNLQVLMFRICNVSELPNGIRGLDSLLILDMGNNSFRMFPKILCDMKNLKRVNLSNPESHKEVLIDHWKWPFPIHTNQINYVSDIASMKIFLSNSKLEKLFLQVNTKDAKLFLKENLNSELLRKCSIGVAPSY